MSVYYNEIDPVAVAWLRELVKQGVLPDGEIDTRSIVDVRPADLRGFRQCHFFAGIGGWAYALQFARWPADRPVWTGSCPCQPFSVAGKGQGADDPRHLWPAWFRLIAECRPDTVFGEQVASADGRYWLDLVCHDLEGSGYAVGAVDLPACSVGAPHGRQRLWIVADRDSTGRPRLGAGGVCEGRPDAVGPPHRQTPCDWIPCLDGKARPVEPGTFPLAHGLPARVGRLRGYGNAIVPQVAQAVIAAYMDLRGIE